MKTKKKDLSPKPDERIYFTKETEDAIVEYNNTEDSEKREEIFREHIEYPLNKMAENIINRFKFPYVNQKFEDTKKQVVSFLVMNLGKYAKGKGKAFSYFSVIAKNYLILHNNTNYKNEKRSVYLSEKTDSDVSVEEILMLAAPDYEQHAEMKEFTELMIDFWENNAARIFKKKRDIEIANAVIELFKRVENIENFNKKALYLMIREMTNSKTSYITKVVNEMRKRVEIHLNEYYEYGSIDRERSKYFVYKK